MKRRFPWWLTLPVAALLVEGAVPFLLRAVYTCAYGPGGALPEGRELWLSYCCIGMGGLVGGVLAAAGVYFLLARSRLGVWIPMMIFVCLPALLVACVYSYGLLVLLALV